MVDASCSWLVLASELMPPSYMLFHDFCRITGDDHIFASKFSGNDRVDSNNGAAADIGSLQDRYIFSNPHTILNGYWLGMVYSLSS